MAAWWSGAVSRFVRSGPGRIVAALAHEAQRHHRLNEAAQLRAWEQSLAILAIALADWPAPSDQLLLEFGVPRLSGRADAVLVTGSGVLVIEFKVGAARFDPEAERQVEDYAFDLHDFHAASRRVPIVPVLVATDAATVPARTGALAISGACPIEHADAIGLGRMLRRIRDRFPASATPIDVARWEAARYDPVPGIIDAACLLFRHHDVAEIASARADAGNLTATADAIDRLLTDAERRQIKLAIFVTGIPGAGKTLCGLNAAFMRQGSGTREGSGSGRAFLTGNPTLVHVLRAALVGDAVARGGDRRAAAQRMKGIIQALTTFRDHGVGTGHLPPERVIVIDEAQRSWTAAQAIAKSRDRPVRLSRSEPAHLLDIMGRHLGFASLVCLVGNGQEIHDGEGGLAGWGEALAERPDWFVAHAPDCLEGPDARATLSRLPGARLDPALHLEVPVRSLRHDDAPSWVDAVLRGDSAAAARLASDDVPFRLTRDLASLRAGLRAACRERHRAGLVASSGARRLRAEGLGAELPHMDADAVAHWFLDSWIGERDVRASDALETVATEFSVQGLELDHVGLCWDGDLVRIGEGAWRVRRFVGTRWQVARDPDKIAWRINTYRVLMTRARYATIVWVPRGDATDPSRDPETLDAVASFLVSCGVRPLAAPTPETLRPPVSPPLLELMEGPVPCAS